MVGVSQPGPTGQDACQCSPDVYRPSNAFTCRDPASAAKTETRSLAVNLKFRNKRWNKVELSRAISLVYGFIDAEKKACYRLVYVINLDQWYVSYIAELLGGKKPPSQQEWSEALMETLAAESAFKRGEHAKAKLLLQNAVRKYNAAAKKWVAYKGGVEKGAERGKLFIEISIIVLSTMVTGGLGNAVRATGLKALAAKGGIAAGGTAYTTIATEVGKVAMGVEKKIDIVKIVGDTLTSFTTSIFSGALADKFLGMFSEKFWLNVIKNKELVAAYKSANVMIPSVSGAKVFFAEMLKGTGFNVAGAIVNDAIQNAIKQSKGKSLTMKSFLELVAAECSKQGLSDVLAKYIVARRR